MLKHFKSFHIIFVKKRLPFVSIQRAHCKFLSHILIYVAFFEKFDILCLSYHLLPKVNLSLIYFCTQFTSRSSWHVQRFPQVKGRIGGYVCSCLSSRLHNYLGPRLSRRKVSLMRIHTFFSSNKVMKFNRLYVNSSKLIKVQEAIVFQCMM